MCTVYLYANAQVKFGKDILFMVISSGRKSELDGIGDKGQLLKYSLIILQTKATVTLHPFSPTVLFLLNI